MAEENEITTEETQVTTKEPQQVQQVTTKEPQQVTTKNPKKVEAGKRLAAHNCRREDKKREEAQKVEGINQYYGTGVVIAIGAIGGLIYYIYQTKKGQVMGRESPPPHQPRPQTNKFQMN